MENKGLELIHSITIPQAQIDQRGKRNEYRDNMDDGYQIDTVICTLQISSHLARNSEIHYDSLHQLYEPNYLASLLTHVSAMLPLISQLS